MKQKTILSILGLFVLLAIISSTFLYGQENNTYTETFVVDKANFSSSGYNHYFSLQPGHQLKLEGKEGSKEVTLIITVLNETKKVDNVETRIVEEKEYKDGEIIEISRNFFAINKLDMSVYYFGEEVDIYKEGKVVSHEGAWESGINKARFGLMMPATVLLGSRYYQEIAPYIAMDRAEIISVNDSLNTPAGIFTNCVKIEETSPLEPGSKGYKVYAPGIGLIKDGSLLLIEHVASKE
jgi:hypothetical protein